MRQFARCRCWASLLLLPGLLLAGCAVPGGPQLLKGGVAEGPSTSASASLPAIVTKKAPLLVRITFPSSIDPSALASSRASYQKLSLGFSAPYGERLNEAALDQALARSAYLAHELYRSLSPALPPNSLVLEPRIFGMNGGRGGYESTASALPAAISIDVFAFVAPKEFWGIAEHGTRGRIASPLVQIYSGSANKSSPRCLAISKPLSVSRGQGAPVLGSLLELQSGARPVGAEVELERLPWYEHLMADEDWVSHLDRSGAARPIFGDRALAPIVQVIISTLKGTKWLSGYVEAEADYFSAFRQEVASAGGVVRADRDEDVLRSFMAAETVATTKISAVAQLELFEGSWGRAMRTSMQAEAEAIQAASRKVQSTAFLGPLGLAGIISGIAEAESQATRMRGLYRESFAPILRRADELRIEVQGESRIIAYDSIEQLRQRLIAIYQSRFGKPR